MNAQTLTKGLNCATIGQMSNTPDIKREEVEKLANLARMALDTAEAEELTADLKEILGYVQEIQSLDTKVAQKEHGTDEVNVFRADEITNDQDEYTDRILSETPTHEGRLVRVKKILEHE